MMLYVACTAGILAVYVHYLAAFIPFWLLVIPCFILLAGHGLWSWRCRLTAAIGFGGLSVLSNSLYVLACINPDYMLMPLLNVAWMLVLLPAIGALGAAWAKLATQENAVRRRSPLVCWALVIVFAIMPALTFATVWPLRLAFLVFRPSLERAADRAEAGETLVSPQWVGPFRLSESAVDPSLKTVGLFIDPNPGGRTGLVRMRPYAPELDHFNLLIGTDTNVQLGWGWSYRQDD
jgi:hypothetical protein